MSCCWILDIMTGNKILIVGAGAIGGYFGACLCRAGADITFLVRPQTYHKISMDGLVIRTPPGDFVVYPKMIKDVAEISFVDLIILAVKRYDFPEVLRQIEPLGKAGATVLTLQNGIDSEEVALSYYGHDCVVAGVVYITARLSEPGVIEHFRS